MAKLHFIAIGGTGHKILQSIIHIAACGAFKGNIGPNRIDTIRVLTVDADDSNGNLNQTKNTLSAYQKFYNALSGSTDLGLVNIETVRPDINLRLFDSERNSISKTFNVARYAQPELADINKLIRFLYTKDEIDSEFNQGFYGHTSIGTLIVKEIISRDDMWKEYIAGISDNDFVMVAGSIFGGTGASSIPIIIEELKKKRKDSNFFMAAMMLTPYFNTVGTIQEEGELQPDSSNFHIKAKASLYYYHDQKQNQMVDALYVIGEPEINFSNEKSSRGAANQCNKAHPMELFAATAVLDFIREAKNINASYNIKTAERESDNDGRNYYTWKMLQSGNQDMPDNMKAFMKAAIFYNKVIYSALSSGRDPSVWQSYYDKLEEKRDSNNNLVFQNIYDYFKLFINYIYDLHKKNQKEIDQNSSLMKWEIDPRVRLFNAQNSDLFDNLPVQNGVIKNFEELVVGQNDGLRSERIHNDLQAKPKVQSKDFVALFATLYEIIRKPLKGGLFGAFGKKTTVTLTENLKNIPYLSNDNGATLQRTPSEPGRLWSSSAPTLLLNIADGLPMTNGDFTRNDISIPSPWSIFIMNELTLTKEKFSGINTEAYRQWCAMITLIALRKVNHYEANGLKLEPPIQNHNDEFCVRIRDTCLPLSYIFSNHDWINGSCVTLPNVEGDVETIAFLANNTLVCPAFSFSKKIMEVLHKIAPTIVNEDLKFTNPDTYFRDQSQTLNQDSKFALRLFLTDLHTVITRIAETNRSDIIRPLLDKISAFMKDIGSVADKKDEITISPNAKNNVSNVHDIFEMLIPIATGRSIDLPFELLDTVDGERTVLIGMNIAGISASSSQAANIFLTETLLFNQMTPQKICDLDGKKQNDGVTLVYADQLLCDNMVIVRKENGRNGFEVLPHMTSLQDYEVIWPVSRKCISLYSMEDLNESLTLGGSQENITVSLKLKIRGKSGSHTVSKTYRIMSSEAAQKQQMTTGVCITVEKNWLPFWTVWPFARYLRENDRKNLWQRYNFLCVERNYVAGIPVMEVRPIFDNRKDNMDGPPQKLTSICTPAFDVFYRRYSDLPVAFELYEKTKAAPVFRGAVFLKQPDDIFRGSTEWNIGLDFGTTSTTAYFTTQTHHEPRFIQLLKQYKWIEGRSAPEEDAWENNDTVVLADFGSRRYLEEYFIDERTLDQNGYSTSYEELDETDSALDSTIFKEGRIFWHNYVNLRNVNFDVEGKRRERLRTNIKWDTNTIFSGKYLNQLMTQIVFMAAKNRVKKINWYFSYPTAFSLSDQGAFSNRIDNIAKALTDQTGIEISYSRNNLLTESIAAAYYFRDKKDKETVFLCADIGGGTSDVSIWIKSRNIFQSSIRFASRDMFIEPLKELLTGDVLSFVSKAADDPIGNMLVINKGVSNDQEKAKFFIETVLFEFYNEFRQRLDSLQGELKEAYKRFKYSVFIAYSGLVYYLANIIAELLNTDNPEMKIDNDVTKIIFGLSGKGSKLTNWIDEYCDILYKESENLIREKTQSKANPQGISIQIAQEFDPVTAKKETAIGMICKLYTKEKQNNQVASVEPKVFMGSDMTIVKSTEEKSCKKGDFVDTYEEFFARPKELTIKIEKNLDALDEFLQFFNRIAAKTKNDMPQVLIDKINKPDLWNQINRQFENVLGSGRFDPPFIVILDVFLKEYFK